MAKEYSGYRHFISFPDGIIWRVCEIPQVVEAGNAMLREGDYPGLSFTTEINGEADIFLSCGALQYMQLDLPEILAKLARMPKHVFINRVPMRDKVDSFYTVQNIGCEAVPYRVENTNHFIQSMSDIGYS